MEKQYFNKCIGNYNLKIANTVHRHILYFDFKLHGQTPASKSF